MSALQEMHLAHKARRERLGMIPQPMKPVVAPLVPVKVHQLELVVERQKGRKTLAYQKLEKRAKKLEVQLSEIRERQAEKERNFQRYREILGEEAPVRWRPTVKFIIQMTADHFRIPVDEIYSQRRNPKYVQPRHVAMYLAKGMTLLSMPHIGRIFGRDHTTVLSALRKIEIGYQNDEELRINVELIRAAINNVGRETEARA